MKIKKSYELPSGISKSLSQSPHEYGFWISWKQRRRQLPPFLESFFDWFSNGRI
jgi:hypothetical protein